MTVNEGCPKCNGRCCEYGLEDYRGASRRGAHSSEAIHTCPYCTNGTKPLVWTAEQERAAVVAWLRAEAEAAAQTYTVQAGEWANRIDALADAIERGEHRRGEEP